MKKLSKQIAVILVLVSIFSASCFGSLNMSKAEEVEAAPVVETVKVEEPAKVEEAPKAEEPAKVEEAPKAEEPAKEESPCEEVTEEVKVVEAEAVEEVTEEVTEQAAEEVAEEVTEEIAEEVAEEVTEEIAEEVAPEAETERSVYVYVRAPEELHLGDKITLVSVLQGYEGCQVTYQWQVNKGSGFEDIKGANGSTYSFAANESTLSYEYRVMVIAE